MPPAAQSLRTHLREAKHKLAKKSHTHTLSAAEMLPKQRRGGIGGGREGEAPAKLLLDSRLPPPTSSKVLFAISFGSMCRSDLRWTLTDFSPLLSRFAPRGRGDL